MIVLDTTVLVYAQGSEHPLRDPCRRLVAAIVDSTLPGTTTPEVIQEFVHVRSRRRGRDVAVRDARAVLAFLRPLITTDEAALGAGLEIYAASARIGEFDAVLAATAMTAGAHALVSADRAFADVVGLRHVVPHDAGITALLDGA